jgi:hypothetical protein
MFSTMTAKKTASNFDDDDMGLFDDNRRSGRGGAAQQPAKSKSSLADELFGRGNANEPSAVSTSQEFKLNEKYTKLSQESAVIKNNDEDPFAFGGYVPSAITPRSNNAALNSAAATQQKRNVSFNDEMFNADLFATQRPKTSPNQGTGSNNHSSNQNMMMKTMPAPAKSSEDWLGLSGNGKRESSNIFDDLLKPKQQQQPAQKPSASSNDWAGVKEAAAMHSVKGDHGSEILGGSEYSAGRPRTALASQTMPTNFNEKQPPSLIAATNMKLTSVKDSMNSSFADSFDAPVAINQAIPATSSVVHPSRGGNAFFDGGKNEVGSIMAPSEAEEGWLAGLMNNASKKAQTANVTAVGKKLNVILFCEICYFIPKRSAALVVCFSIMRQTKNENVLTHGLCLRALDSKMVPIFFQYLRNFPA